jgi:antitoxin VapB
MATARVFRSGNSQVVRLPKEFQVKSKELEIFRRGDEIVLREKGKGLARAFEILANLPDDFLPDGRQDTPPQERETLRLEQPAPLDAIADLVGSIDWLPRDLSARSRRRP